jgi:hypothetical protein
MMDESGSEKIPNLSLNFLSGALNFLLSRPVSFIAPIKGKRFTDPFFRLLDFFDRNVKMF